MKINKTKCIGCGACVDACPMMAITVEGGTAKIDENSCVDCGICAYICPNDAPEDE